MPREVIIVAAQLHVKISQASLDRDPKITVTAHAISYKVAFYNGNLDPLLTLLEGGVPPTHLDSVLHLL